MTHASCSLISELGHRTCSSTVVKSLSNGSSLCDCRQSCSWRARGEWERYIARPDGERFKELGFPWFLKTEFTSRKALYDLAGETIDVTDISADEAGARLLEVVHRHSADETR